MGGQVAPGTLLSTHLSWAEVTTTQSRDPEILRQQMDPPAYVRLNLLRLAHDIFEPARSLVGPMLVTSGYRCEALNRSINGSPTSNHVHGLCLDVVPLEMSMKDAMVRLAGSAVPFDQIIFESPTPYSHWLHLGAAKHGSAPRGQRLMMLALGQYETWRPSDPRVRGSTAVV